MLQKLFRTHSLKQSEEKNVDELLEPTSWTPIPFEPHQIRVLVCQDSGDKRKIPLLDTNLSREELVAQPVPSVSSTRSILGSSWSEGGLFSSRPRSKRNSLNNISPSSGCGPSIPSHRKLGYNLDIIGEMMFGAVPLSYKGMTTKIHHIKGAKPQILLTKLFSINMGDLELLSGKSRRSMSIASECSDVSTESWATTGNDHWNNNPTHRNAASNEINKAGEDRSRHGSVSSSIFSVDENNSEEDHTVGAYPTGIPTARSCRDASNQSLSSSFSSYKDRRLWRSSQTSIENGVFNPTPLPGKPYFGTSSVLKHSSRSIMYSIGVVISLEDNKSLREYLFSHFSLLEARLHKLHDVVMSLLCPLLRRHLMKAQMNPQNSMYPHKNGTTLSSLPPYSLQTENVLKEAVSKFVQDICDLYQTPRLQIPLWLNLHTFPHNRISYYQSFITELTDMLNKFDTPKSNHFISTLFTAVLTNHLSWVPTVTPPGLNDSRNSEANSIFDNAGLSYNPLWAQYSDLYGNTGSPSRLCRVIVVGTSAPFVKRILYILSYLLRCNEVFENVEELAIDDYDSQSDSSSIPRESPNSLLYGVNQQLHLTTLKESELKGYNHGTYTRGTQETQNQLYSKPLSSSPTQRIPDNPSKFDVKFEKTTSLPITDSTHKISQVTEQLLNETSSERSGLLESEAFNIPTSFNGMKRSSTRDIGVYHEFGHKSLADSVVGESVGDEFSLKPEGFVEIPMVESQMITQIPGIGIATTVVQECSETRPDRLFAKSFGRSMMVGYCSKYMSDFVLMGLARFDFLDELENDLKDSVQYHVDGPVSQSSCIIADTNTWQCNIVDYTPKPELFDSGFEENFPPKKGVTIQRVLPSDFVRQTLSQMQHLFRLGIPAESCARYFEDMLQELYLKSRVIAEFLDSQEMDRTFDHKALGAIVNLKESDMPLLISVAKTYSLKSNQGLDGRI
ncbi:hypothetical protein K7432_003011 [Basidiobolus ranarum]|uniref:UDENN FNIP1/2-type domain-containing protein n=1 Tax=Basidiobolus ranarum TaxID=34480 RepID=A0ABR2W728_9FUNG